VADVAAASDAVIAELLGRIVFDARGLVPAIAQDHASGEVLMLAWMDREAVRLTLATAQVNYWSRSRQSLWRKGETSGHTQALIEFRVDCDNDAILVRVDQTGPACHTGQRTCFFTALRDGKVQTVGD
jgi:phosphoribosyl-AMP cyclohydrolase